MLFISPFLAKHEEDYIASYVYSVKLEFNDILWTFINLFVVLMLLI